MEEALVMPSTPVLIYGLFVLLFILIAIPAGRMIDKANKETDESIRLLLKRRDERLQIASVETRFQAVSNGKGHRLWEPPLQPPHERSKPMGSSTH